ncbi:MAG: response regulator [Polyangiaceae bacterium]
MHVLICDDEARLATLSAQLLESHGFETSSATDASSARKRIVTEAVQAMVLDVNLPGESSADLLDFLQEHAEDVRVLLTSGLAEDDVPEALRRHPLVVGYVPKPYSIDVIAQRLHELFDA